MAGSKTMASGKRSRRSSTISISYLKKYWLKLKQLKRTKIPVSAKQLTREEILQLTLQYKAIIQDPATLPDEKLKSQLAFLGIEREVMYCDAFSSDPIGIS